MDDARSELVVSLRPRAGLEHAVGVTLLGTALVVVGVLSVVGGAGNWMGLLQGPLMVGLAWHTYRVLHRRRERLRIGPHGLAESGAAPLPWPEVAALSWQPPWALGRLLGSPGRLRLLTETQRRFAHRHDLTPSTRPLSLWGLDHDRQQILDHVAAYAPHAVRAPAGERTS